MDQIVQMDPFDPNLDIDSLRNAFIDAQKFLKEKVTFNNFIEIIL